MESPKVFTCQSCDAELEINNPQNQTRVRCRQCGRISRLVYIDEQMVWSLETEEPVESEAGQRSQVEEPFTVLAEVGRPRRDDRSEEYREQSDIHEDEDQAIDKEHRKP